MRSPSRRCGAGPASQDRWHPFVRERDDSEDCLDWVWPSRGATAASAAYGTAYSAVGATADGGAGPGRAEGGRRARHRRRLPRRLDLHLGRVRAGLERLLGVHDAERVDRPPAVDDATRAELKARHARAIIDAPAMAARLPLRDHPLLTDAGDTQFHEWLDHPDYDDYWAGVDLLARAERMRRRSCRSSVGGTTSCRRTSTCTGR